MPRPSPFISTSWGTQNGHSEMHTVPLGSTLAPNGGGPQQLLVSDELCPPHKPGVLMLTPGAFWDIGVRLMGSSPGSLQDTGASTSQAFRLSQPSIMEAAGRACL